MLLIKGIIELDRDDFREVYYINDEDYSVSKPSNSEFAGSFCERTTQAHAENEDKDHPEVSDK